MVNFVFLVIKCVVRMSATLIARCERNLNPLARQVDRVQFANDVEIR